jgi:hypothetical protein
LVIETPVGLYFIDWYCYFKRLLCSLLEPSFSVAHNCGIWTSESVWSTGIQVVRLYGTVLTRTPHTACILLDGWDLLVVVSSALSSSFQGDQ